MGKTIYDVSQLPSEGYASQLSDLISSRLTNKRWNYVLLALVIVCGISLLGGVSVLYEILAFAFGSTGLIALAITWLNYHFQWSRYFRDDRAILKTEAAKEWLRLCQELKRVETLPISDLERKDLVASFKEAIMTQQLAAYIEAGLVIDEASKKLMIAQCRSIITNSATNLLEERRKAEEELEMHNHGTT